MKENRRAAAVPALKFFRTGSKESALPLILILAGLVICLVLLTGQCSMAQEKVKTARPSVNGALHVSGTVLTDQKGCV